MSLAIVFSKLCVSSVIENIQKSSSRLLHVTQVVSAEPMKKRKRIDPKVVQARLDRRKRKIEKQIRRLQKNARQLKPIDEIEIPKAIWNREDRNSRIRPISKLMEEQIESREVLHKEWARYQRARKLQLYNDCLRALKSQNTALFKLREESEVLYQAAIESDDNLFPIKIKGPVCTSPILNYESPAEMVIIKM